MQKILLCCIVFFALGMSGAVAQTTNYNAYSLILINVAKYAEWPDNGKDVFVIAVVGKSKVYDELVKKQGYKINGKSMQVVQVNDVLEIKEKPHIIYISDHKSSVINELQEKFASDPIMFVSEREGLFKKGAHLSFIIIEETKLRFDINKSEMLRRNLKISNNILTIAHEII